MEPTPRSRRDRIRAQRANLKMPGALEALDEVLAHVDSGSVTSAQAIEELLGAQVSLPNNRRRHPPCRVSDVSACNPRICRIHSTIVWQILGYFSRQSSDLSHSSGLASLHVHRRPGGP